MMIDRRKALLTAAASVVATGCQPTPPSVPETTPYIRSADAGMDADAPRAGLED